MRKELNAEDRIFVSPRGVGFHIDIVASSTATVRLAVIAGDGKVVLDEFDVPREKALDAIEHPTLYSEKYREALV